MIAVIGVLVSLLLPAIQASRESARRTECANQLHQLALAAESHVSAKSEYPPGVKQWYFNEAVSHRGVTLFAFLLPYMEEGQALAAWDLEDPMNNATDGAAARAAQVLPGLMCASDEIPQNPIAVDDRGWSYALTSYGGNGGTRSYFPSQATADGMFHTTGEASEPKQHQTPVRPRHVTDGLSKTILFGERSHTDANYQTFNDAGWGEPLDEWGWWAASTSRKMIGHVTMSAHAPLNYRLPFTYDDRGGQTPPAGSYSAFAHYATLRICAYGSNHPGGANFAFADGSVRFLRTETDAATLGALSTRAAGD